MIAGLGIDLIEVERVAAKIGKEAGFRELVFSQKEIDYCESKADKFVHYAARFAAKEAFFKALGTGWTEGTAFNEVELTHDEAGKPGISLLGRTAGSLAGRGTMKISLSISHLKTIASAVVIIEIAS
jgi:holo-[acyl-carrier protein] synthase